MEKTLDRFETLSREFGEEKVWEMCGPEEKETLVTFLAVLELLRTAEISAWQEPGLGEIFLARAVGAESEEEGVPASAGQI